MKTIETKYDRALADMVREVQGTIAREGRRMTRAKAHRLIKAYSTRSEVEISLAIAGYRVKAEAPATLAARTRLAKAVRDIVLVNYIGHMSRLGLKA